MNKIRYFLEQQFNDFNSSAFVRILKIFCCCAFIVITYAMFFSGFQIVDEFEHLHASWLVSIGKVPYLDFFEHHNPFMWYLFSPLVSFFYDKAIVFYYARGFSCITSVVTLLYIYKISLFWGDKKAGFLAIALTLCNIVTIYNFYQFRPDNFMNMFFIIGVYYLFLHLKNKNLSSLTISFVCFATSFLFLQKIAFILIAVEFILVILLLLKKIKIYDIMLAIIPVIIISILFVLYLYKQNNLLSYIAFNFNFNKELVLYFSKGSFWIQSIGKSVYMIAFISAIYFFKKENIYFKIVSFLYITEFLMRAFYFSPHPNYYTLLTMLSSLVLSIYVAKFFDKSSLFRVCVTIFLFINLGLIFNRLDNSIQKRNSYEYYKMVDYVHKNSSADDFVMNGYDTIINIYRKDVDFFWFGLDMLLPVIEKRYGLDKQLDVNLLVLKYKPKFVYTADYIDLLSLRSYGEVKYSQKFIPELLNNFYNQTSFEYLMKLK